MFTVIEMSTFTKLVADYWNEDELGEFAAWLASDPEMDGVVPRSGGVLKVRWSLKGRGKRGGVRVIYYNRLANGEI